MKFLHLVWSNLKRKKLRTILTILSIVVAFVLYGFLSAIQEALAAGVSVAGADRLVVRHKVSIIQLLPISYEDRMARIPGVARVTHCTWFGGSYLQEPKYFFAQVPVDPESFLEIYPEFIVSAEAKKKWLETRTGAVVGRTIAERFGWKAGSRVPIEARIWTKADGSRTWEFDIVGIYDGAKKGTDTTQFLFRHDYFDEARTRGKGEVNWYVVRVQDPNRATEIAQKINDEFANSFAETQAETEGAFVQGFAKQIGDIGSIMAVILGAAFFTILLVAGNTMAQAVRERAEELGVLKALGFTDAQVLRLVLLESFFLSMLGGFVGLALAYGLISLGDPTHGALVGFYFPVKRIAMGVAFVLLLGLISGLLPAIQAMRLRIADALRRM